MNTFGIKMDKINKENLEKALASKSKNIPKEQEIAYHQGVLNTLIAERTEMIKIIGNVEMIMKAHLKRLEELGVKIKKE
jgi:hypothetical protein